MAPERSAIASLARWAEPVPAMGRAVYRITNGPKEHKHTYHIFCPWSPDQELLVHTRFDRTEPVGEICVLETKTGDVRVVGRVDDPTIWNSHATAYQQWQGDAGRIAYASRTEDGHAIVSVRPDGSDARTVSTEGLQPPGFFCSPDGRWAYGATDLGVMFPDDEITRRDDKGLWRIDLETGERKLILSVDQAIALHPERDTIKDYHMWVKMVIHHRRLPRILFNLTNTFWDRAGGEPRIRGIVALDADGSHAAWLGTIRHHPNWHSVDDLALANVSDCNNETRFGLYRGDGRGLVEYVPVTRGSGHPSFGPDGRLLFTDGSGPRGTQLIFCEPTSGRSVVAAEYEAVSDGYASFNAIDERTEGETIVSALKRGAAMRSRNWQTQSHPAWSRDGSAIVFNADLGEGSQLYVVDVERALGDT